MEFNYTQEFDEELLKLSIYDRYSVMLPFVGFKYSNSKNKILFIGESHYLPKENNNKIGIEWYDNHLEMYNFRDLDVAYINTREILDSVINYTYKNNSHSIFRNFANVYGDVFGYNGYKESLAYISFYNYFLRPAEVKGKSIKNKLESDDFRAFENLVALNKILKPDKIVFASRLAKNAFHKVYWSNSYKGDKRIDVEKVDSIPHPGCAWWNRVSKSYGNISGKQKLESIFLDLRKNEDQF